MEESNPVTAVDQVELPKLLSHFDSQFRQVQNYLREMEEEDADESEEPPPEALPDDTALTTRKLLQGNLKDLINTFLVMYDASLKNVVSVAGT